MTHFIYALYSTRDGMIRYVGETKNPDRRLSREFENRRVQQWMEKEPWYGHQIECEILEECAFEERKLREMTYMAKFENLLNDQSSGIIGFYRDRNDLENEKIFECRRAIERFRKSVDWNYEGFTGIARLHRSSAFPVYTVQASVEFIEKRIHRRRDGVEVLIPTPRCHTEYLPSKFEEFAKAVEARDAAIERLKTRFPDSSVYPDEIDRP